MLASQPVQLHPNVCDFNFGLGACQGCLVIMHHHVTCLLILGHEEILLAAAMLSNATEKSSAMLHLGQTIFSPFYTNLMDVQ
jgi:hypothetical protein